MTRLPGGVGVLLVVAIVILTAGCGSIVNELEGVGGPGDNETDTDGEADDSSTDDENATDNNSEAGDNESESNDAEESPPPDSDDDETESDDDNGGETDTDETDQSGGSDTNDDGSDGQDGQDGDADQDDGGDGNDQDDSDPAEPGQSLLTLTVVGPAGEPIEGASVAGEGEPHEADIPLEFSGGTDSEGKYTDVIYENEYTIEVDHPDYQATSIQHTHDGDREVTVELEHAGDGGSEPPTSLLTLTVVDSDGDPIEGATVIGEGEPHDADIPLTFNGETDANGQYTDVIYENQYSIEVNHPDYESTTVNHNHDGEQEVEVELNDGNGDGEGELEVTDLNVDAGTNVQEEWIEFGNTGDAPLDMSGWMVTDRGDGGTGSEYYFANGFILEPGERVRLVTGHGTNTESTVYWRQGAPRWNQNGDIVIVENANGNRVLTYEYGNPSLTVR